MTIHHSARHEQFYGTTTLGEKGQIVIPAKARTDFKLKKGEKMLVFGIGTNMLTIAKFDAMEKFASHLANRLATVQSIIKKR